MHLPPVNRQHTLPAQWSHTEHQHILFIIFNSLLHFSCYFKLSHYHLYCYYYYYYNHLCSKLPILWSVNKMLLHCKLVLCNVNQTVLMILIIFVNVVLFFPFYLFLYFSSLSLSVPQHYLPLALYTFCLLCTKKNPPKTAQIPRMCNSDFTS